jgi:Acetokinase family
MRAARPPRCRRPEPANGYDPRRQRRLVQRQVPGVRVPRFRGGGNEARPPHQGPEDGIGTRPRLRAKGADGTVLVDQSYAPSEVDDPKAALETAGAWLRGTQKLSPIAVGHRIVHGGPEYDRPILIDRDVLGRLERYVPLAPLHQPNNLAPVRSLLTRMPELPQVACFDTSFHRSHGALADHYAIPQRLYAEGVRRYGFHGLSYEYIAGRLPEVAPEIAAGRVIVAHLGSGASMCALSAGRSIESTMGFTALDGLPMGTRPGQIDPGVVLYLIAEKQMSADQVQVFLYENCGLKGLSGISNDVRESRSEYRSESAIRPRLLRLPGRALCRDAGGRTRRRRRFRVHRRDRRELAEHARAHHGTARLARRRARLEGERGRRVPDIGSREPPRDPRRADRRGADDRAPYRGAARHRPRRLSRKASLVDR